jgi:hypothetical protein
MFNDLTALGYGLVVFSIIIGVGSVVLYNFGIATANCATGFAINSSSAGLCINSTGSTATPSGASYVNTAYLLTQLGSSGLAGWTPAVIAISVGLLFLGAFLVRGGGKRR